MPVMTLDRPRPSETPFARLAAALGTWPGVVAGPGRFGATEFRYGPRELGHIHGDDHADLPFPTWLRDVLVEERRAEPHRYLPASGWVSVTLSRPGGVERALELFRLNYDLIVRKKQPPEPMPEG